MKSVCRNTLTWSKVSYKYFSLRYKIWAVCSPVTDYSFEAKLYTWNWLKGAGMCCMDLELISRAGMAILWKSDQGGGKWGNLVAQLVTVSPSLGSWIGATVTIYPSCPSFLLRLDITLTCFFLYCTKQTPKMSSCKSVAGHQLVK